MKTFNKFILETYKPEALKSEIKHGLAMVSQKNNLVGLKLLVDAQISSYGTLAIDGLSAPYVVRKGTVVYIREEILHTSVWAKNSLKSAKIEGNFIIVDPAFVEMVDEDGSAGQPK